MRANFFANAEHEAVQSRNHVIEHHEPPYPEIHAVVADDDINSIEDEVVDETEDVQEPMLTEYSCSTLLTNSALSTDWKAIEDAFQRKSRAKPLSKASICNQVILVVNVLRVVNDVIVNFI